jgi:membrane associated rhomboid family serine protease
MAALVVSEGLQWWLGDLSGIAGYRPIEFSIHPWMSILTLAASVFLHGGVMHLLGNLLFLWVFGRTLEGLFGHRKFLIAFPLLGMAGNLVHWAIYPNSDIPVIGASGAIAALMGAYFGLFPRARVRILFWLAVPLGIWTPRAWLVLSAWIALQLFSVLTGEGEVSGVAYAVHVGGFVVGLVAAIIWKVQSIGGEEKLTAYIAERRQKPASD